MLDSKNLATKSATKKLQQLLQFPQGTALSAALLIALVPSVQAADSNNNIATTSFSDTFNAKTASCDNNMLAQTSRTKRQSAQRQDIDCMLTQLRMYELQKSNHSPREQYFAYKAQAWLTYASYEDGINNRSAAGEYALQTGTAMLTELQNNNDQSLSLTTDIPSTSALMRPDLWATLTALKDSGGITTAPRELAFSEVALIWAATNHCSNGWRQSASHFRMADRWLEQAREAYINAHSSESNVKLENLINQYYKQFAPLDPSDDSCRGQVLPMSTQTLQTEIARTMSIAPTITIPIPMPTATYTIVY